MKNYKTILKITALCLALVLSVGLLAACGKPVDETPTSSAPEVVKDATEIRVAVIQGPTGVGMAHLMEQDAKGKTEYDYNFNLITNPQQTVAMLSNKSVDIAAMPTNLAANFSGKNGDITVLAVNTLGVLHIADATGEVTDIASLKGKTIYSTGQGSNPEFILNYILEKNGLDPKKDVTIKFIAENQELTAKMVLGEIEIAMVPEPVLTNVMLKNNKVKPVVDMTKEWARVGGEGDLMMGCVAVRNEFLKKSPNAVASFMKEYEASVKYCEDTNAAAALSVKHEIIPNEQVAKQAIPRCNIKFVSGEDMKTRLSGYLNVLFAANPNSIGGKLPDESFYYNK